MYLLMYKMNKSGTFSDIWGLSETYKHNIIKSKDDLEATLGKLKNEGRVFIKGNFVLINEDKFIC